MKDSEYDIVEAFRVIEEELIASMIRNMDRHRAEEEKEGKQWSQWQTEQLKALETYKRKNQKKYSAKFQDLNKRIESLIRTAHETGGMEQEIEILEKIKNGFQDYNHADSALLGEFFRLNEEKLEALVKAVTDDMEKAETAILRMANDKYRKAIYNAQVYANTGAGTYEKAVDMAVKDMLAAGLNCIEYANGARHTLPDYADMAIRTATKRAYLQGEGVKRKEWGIHTVILNKRQNPCPKCLPFCGKVLIDDVWSGGSSEDGPYPLMSMAVAKGLFHPRCKDSHTTYFPGISTQDDTWTDEELEAVGMANRKEARKQYAERQEEKYERLAKYSLDAENQKKYAARREEWKKRWAEKTEKQFEKNIIKRPLLKQEEIIEQAKKYGEEAMNNPQVFRYGNGDPVTDYVNRKLGYDALPKCISEEEFASLKEGKQVLYRGVTDTAAITADEMVEAFKRGDFFAGRGIYGYGTYTDVNKKVAEYYAEENGSGKIMEMLLSDDARTVDFVEIFKEYEKTGIPKIIGEKPEAYQDILGNLGTYASMKGYDAILLNGFQNKYHVVVLNRGKVIVKE